MKTARLRHVGLALGCLLLACCPAVIRLDQILHAKDETAPVVTITSPADGSYCARTVIVEGVVQEASRTTSWGAAGPALFRRTT